MSITPRLGSFDAMAKSSNTMVVCVPPKRSNPNVWKKNNRKDVYTLVAHTQCVALGTNQLSHEPAVSHPEGITARVAVQRRRKPRGFSRELGVCENRGVRIDEWESCERKSECNAHPCRYM